MRAFLLLPALLLLTPAAPAAPGFAPAIETVGNGRTRDSHIRNLTRRCLERQAPVERTTLDVPALEQCLLDSRLFAEVAVTVDDDTLTVAVDERWSLIPIPFARSQGDDQRAGLFLLETNFLGMGKTLVAGGTMGNRGNTGFLLYKDPSIAFSRWVTTVTLRYQIADMERYEGADAVDGFTVTESAASASVGYEVTPYWTLSAFGQRTRRDYTRLDGFGPSPHDYRYLAAGPALEYDRTRYRFYFQAGSKLQARAERQLDRHPEGGDPATTYRLMYDWQANAGGRNVFKFNLASQAVIDGDLRDALMLGDSRGVRGIPVDGLWAQRLTTTSLEYQIPIHDGRIGTWTVGPYAEAGEYRTPRTLGGDAGRYDSWGLASFLYLKRVALPGVGIVVGHNDAFLGGFVSVAVGFGM